MSSIDVIIADVHHSKMASTKDIAAWPHKHKLPSSLHKILLACATNSLLRLRSSTPVDISMMNRMISTPLIISSRRGLAASLSSRRLPTTTSTSATANNSWSSSSSIPSFSLSNGLPFKRYYVSSSTPASSSSAAAVTASFNEDDVGSNTSNDNNNDNNITSSRFSIQGTFREGRASYLDASATTPLDPRVLDKMMPYMVSE